MRYRLLEPGLLLTLALLIYWPGLSGGFLFDDSHVIEHNAALDISEFSLPALLDAAFSSNTGPTGRPLAMLSFAANRSLGGAQPFGFKLTNLFIHAANGLLVLALLRRLLPRLVTGLDPRLADRTAFACAAIWLVHPINVSSVLYVSQRMTLLASTFMLLAMLAYCHMRTAASERRTMRFGTGGLVCCCALLAAGAKEIALLLPFYLLVIEAYGFRFHGLRVAQLSRAIALVTGTAAGAACIGLAWHSGWLNYSGRDFTLTERLLTESRVIWAYVRMIFLPDIGQFALFHDDVLVSTAALRPPVTLPAVVGVGAAAVLALARRPMLPAFAAAWFLAGHLLESTMVPLELMHEHRNYLPAVGPIAAVGACIAMAVESGVARTALAGVALALGMAITMSRAFAWADPWLQMARESHHHPQSSRTTYEFGRLSVARAGRFGDARLLADGLAAMERSLFLPGGAQPHIGFGSLLNYASNHGDTARLRRYLDWVRVQPRSRVRTRVLDIVVSCQLRGECAVRPELVMTLFSYVVNDEAAFRIDSARAREILAIYYVELLDDVDAALGMLSEIVAEWPANAAFRLTYAETLARAGRRAELARELRALTTDLSPVDRIIDRARVGRLAKLERYLESFETNPH